MSVALLPAMACGLVTVPRGTVAGPGGRSRAFVDTFDRILIAGFLAPRMSDRGRRIDINEETARLLRAMLRSKGALDVIDAQPVPLSSSQAAATSSEEAVFNDTAFWKRLGEEYREPLILTGTVAFGRAGPQFEERSVGPRSVTMWRPRYRLDVRLVFISGRTGDVLDSLSLRPVMMRASDGRTSALALYFALMDELTPAVLAAFGRETALTANR